MRFLIAAPRHVERYGEYAEFPLGLAYISACLKHGGYDVVCVNLNYVKEDIEEALSRIILENEIDVFLTGGLSGHFNKIEHMVRFVKTVKRELVVIIGGGIITADPEFILEVLGADIGVIGEGEETIVEVAEALSNDFFLDNVKGIVYREKNGGQKKTGGRPPIKDLDALPMPDYEGLGIEAFLDTQLPSDRFYTYLFDAPRTVHVIGSRSCPFRCSFCFHPLGNKYRRRSPEGLISEITFLKEKYGINSLVLLDELFSMDKKKVSWFASRMKPLDLKWTASFRVNSVDRRMLAELKDCGLYHVGYGLESASDQILKSMAKKTSVAEIETTLEFTRKEKIGIHGVFLFGDPAETMETARETIDWWEKNHSYQLDMNPIVPYPGTKIYNHALDNGIITDKLDYLKKDCPAINLTDLNDREYLEIFSMVSKAQYEHRVLGVEPVAHEQTAGTVAGKPLYSLEVACPHCGERNHYMNIRRNDVGYFKLGCRYCHQKYHVNSLIFGHVAKRLFSVREKIQKLILNKTPLSVTPCINPYLFLSMMDSLEISWDKLNVKSFLDQNPDTANTTFWDRFVPDFKLLPRQIEVIKRKCHDHTFLILPAVSMPAIIDEMRDVFLIPENRLVILGEDNFQL